MSEDKKICPFCGEEILAVAKKCKYCNTWLTEESSYEQISQQELSTAESRNSVNSTLGYDICGLVFACLSLCITFSVMFDPSDPDYIYMCLGWIMLNFFPLAIAILGLFNKYKAIGLVTLGITCLNFLLLFICLFVSFVK